MNANAILLKLGGIGFMCKTGAYNFLNQPDYLQFSLPNGATCRIDAGNGATFKVSIYSALGELRMSRKNVEDLPLFFTRHVIH